MKKVIESMIYALLAKNFSDGWDFRWMRFPTYDAVFSDAWDFFQKNISDGWDFRCMKPVPIDTTWLLKIPKGVRLTTKKCYIVRWRSSRKHRGKRKKLSRSRPRRFAPRLQSLHLPRQNRTKSWATVSGPVCSDHCNPLPLLVSLLVSHLKSIMTIIASLAVSLGVFAWSKSVIVKTFSSKSC